ncbi:MAG TPA: NAD(P)/FAD-dependent oxidoreductase [Thermoleophilaceae bacterium]|nr:NAD(P)/FAD-dependent oxidoreductase [Thermoleophilaceae bacterium]
MSASPTPHRVVVVGGGFGGLETVKALRGAPVDVTLIDRNNYHLFQPLNYQVATGALSPDEIAEPLRTIFRKEASVRVVMAEVTAVDLERRRVRMEPGAGELEPRELEYDTLVVAGGSAYSYFGHEEWRPFAVEVKSLETALDARGRILRAFEAAELNPSREARAAWLTFVVVGGGPTGVEMAGQIAELARDTLPGDFRVIDPRFGRVLLVETADRVLPAFPPQLSKRAAESLEQIGATPLVDHTVVGIDPDGVDLRSRDGQTQRVATRTVIWAAGVTASPLAAALADASGAELDRAGRVTVEPDLTIPGHPAALAIGDMVRVRNPQTGKADTLPGLAPVAMQQGRYAGRLIRDRLAGDATPPFRYRDKGNLATIGRARAVADVGRVKISGFLAWVTWLVVHLYYLIGFENRLVVLVRWSYNFFTRGRGGRLITGTPERRRAPVDVGRGQVGDTPISNRAR